MKQAFAQRFPPSATARGRRPTVFLGGVLLMWWAYLVLGANLPWLLIAAGTGVTAIWLLRNRRDLAACVAVGALTATIPAVTCVVLVDRQVTGASDVVAVLTGYILVAPIPALAAATPRAALLPPLGNALLGSGVLLLGTIPSVVFGEHGDGALLLVVALTSSVALIWHRNRRAAEALLTPLPQVNGWTDLGRRYLPDGTPIEQLLIGNGHVIACSTAAPSTRAQEQDALRAAHTAAVAAAVLGLAGGRVQPVLLTERENLAMQTHLVNDGRVAGPVIVASRRHLEDVTRLAPPSRRRLRSAVLTGAMLPTTVGATA